MTLAVMAMAMVVLAQSAPVPEDSETAVLERLDAESLSLKSDVPKPVQGSGAWEGYANRFTMKVSNLERGVASGQSLPRIIVDSGLCSTTAPCYLALAYEFSYRDAPPGKRTVFRVVMRNAAGRRWEGLALHQDPGNQFRYWISSGGPWEEQQGTSEVLTLHGRFYDEVLSILQSHPVRKPLPKTVPGPPQKKRTPSAPAVVAGAFFCVVACTHAC